MDKRTLALWGGAVLATALLLQGSAAAQPPGKPAQPSAGVVNVNTATPDQLRLLPSIGPTKAERIVAYRSKHRFRSVHDLARVKGIGRRTLQRLKPYLTLDGPTTLTRKPKPRGDARSGDSDG